MLRRLAIPMVRHMLLFRKAHIDVYRQKPWSSSTIVSTHGRTPFSSLFSPFRRVGCCEAGKCAFLFVSSTMCFSCSLEKVWNIVSTSSGWEQSMPGSLLGNVIGSNCVPFCNICCSSIFRNPGSTELGSLADFILYKNEDVHQVQKHWPFVPLIDALFTIKREYVSTVYRWYVISEQGWEIEIPVSAYNTSSSVMKIHQYHVRSRTALRRQSPLVAAITRIPWQWLGEIEPWWKVWGTIHVCELLCVWKLSLATNAFSW